MSSSWRNSGFSRSRSFQMDRRSYSSGPDLPERSSPAVLVPLTHEFTAQMSATDSKNFLDTNSIKLSGPTAPTPVTTFEDLNLPDNLVHN